MSAICRLSRVIVCLPAIVSIGTQLLIMMIWSSASNEGYPKVREDFTITERAYFIQDKVKTRHVSRVTRHFIVALLLSQLFTITRL